MEVEDVGGVEKKKGGKAGVGCTRRLEVGREHQQQNMIHASTIIAGRREGGGEENNDC